MNIRYSACKEEVRPQIEEMIFSLYREDPEGIAINSDKVHATFARCKAYPEKAKLIAIWHEKELVGYALVVFFWSNEFGGEILCLDELYIKKDFRCHGIGSSFIKDIPELFPETVAVHLEVAPSNKRAKSLYENLGFIQNKNLTMLRIFNRQ